MTVTTRRDLSCRSRSPASCFCGSGSRHTGTERHRRLLQRLFRTRSSAPTTSSPWSLSASGACSSARRRSGCCRSSFRWSWRSAARSAWSACRSLRRDRHRPVGGRPRPLVALALKPPLGWRQSSSASSQSSTAMRTAPRCRRLSNAVSFALGFCHRDRTSSPLRDPLWQPRPLRAGQVAVRIAGGLIFLACFSRLPDQLA